MLWPFRAGSEAKREEYRLDRPLADCPGCWKARAVALYWASAACRECGRTHRNRWLPHRPLRR